MSKGYFRKQEQDIYKLACLRSDILNTIPRRKGSPSYSPDDFMPRRLSKAEIMTLEHRHELAQKALERSKRFDKGGVIYSDFREIDTLKHG